MSVPNFWWDTLLHDDVIKWKHFPRYWPFVRGIHQSPVNSPHKGQWSGALIFSFICVWINSWVNNRAAGDLRCYRAHYDVIVMDAWVIRHEMQRPMLNIATLALKSFTCLNTYQNGRNSKQWQPKLNFYNAGDTKSIWAVWYNMPYFVSNEEWQSVISSKLFKIIVRRSINVIE